MYDYIAEDSILYAEKQVEEIYERIKILKKFPLSGKIVPEFNTNSVRELIQGHYRIIYKIISDQSISIVTIHHSSKLLK